MYTRITAAFTLALILLPTLAIAQTVEGAVKGGVTFADIPRFADVLGEDADANTDLRIGAVVGGALAFPIGGPFSLQPEVLYTQRGLEGSVPSLGETFKLKLSYVDLPVLVRIGPARGRGFHFLAGPSFNFNIDAQLIVGGTFNDEEDFKNEVEDVDIGMVVGGGYYGSLLIVEGRFEEGLTNVSTFADDESYRNRTIIAMVGMRFGRKAGKTTP